MILYVTAAPEIAAEVYAAQGVEATLRRWSRRRAISEATPAKIARRLRSLLPSVEMAPEVFGHRLADELTSRRGIPCSVSRDKVRRIMDGRHPPSYMEIEAYGAVLSADAVSVYSPPARASPSGLYAVEYFGRRHVFMAPSAAAASAAAIVRALRSRDPSAVMAAEDPAVHVYAQGVNLVDITELLDEASRWSKTETTS